MLRILKLKCKLINLTKNDDEKNKIKLEIYSNIMGYFACKKDRSFGTFNDTSILEDLENKIKNIFKTNYRIIGVKNNSYESFNVFLDNVQNENNIIMCELAQENFNEGYNYFINLHNNISIMDILILNKPARIEYKLIKALNQK